MISKLKFVLQYAKKYRYWYIGGIIFLALTQWISVTIPEYMQKSIDLITLQQPTDKNLFYRYILFIFGLAAGLIIVRSLSRILFFIPARLIEKQLKNDMFKKISSFGRDYFDNNEAGSVISRFNNDIMGVRVITGFGIMQIINIIFSMSITPFKMWQLSWQLTLYCVLPIIFVFIFVRWGMIYMVKNTQLRTTSLQNLSAKTVSFLSGISIIKSFSLYNQVTDKFHEENYTLFKYTTRIAKIRAFVFPLLINLEQILKIVVLIAGGLIVINQKLTIGELTAFITYATLLTMPIMGFGWVISVFQQGMVGIASVQTIMNRKGTDEEKIKTKQNVEKDLFKDGIEIKDLNFSYNEKPVLQNISFKINPGSIIGITGKVGSGKSTLINCLNRYLEVNENQIFFSNKDITTLTGAEVRSVIRTVSQDVFLFSDTVENNILFGSAQAKEKSTLEKVIYESALYDDVNRFPEKEKTIVGEKGIMLSGGQKQRISLARAIFTPCEVLILDDVFSAVDTETERFLMKHIVENHPAKSILIISNKTSVLEKTDFILVLEDGKISASGNHSELLEKSEYYRHTWEIQQNKN